MTSTPANRRTGTARADGARADGAGAAADGRGAVAGGAGAAADGAGAAADGRGAVAGARSPFGYIDHKDALVNRMRRIEGQARGIERMITEDRYCVDILTQIAAVSTALESAASILLEDHVNHCVRNALESGDTAVAAEKANELLRAVQRFTRTR